MLLLGLLLQLLGLQPQLGLGGRVRVRGGHREARQDILPRPGDDGDGDGDGDDDDGAGECGERGPGAGPGHADR